MMRVIYVLFMATAMLLVPTAAVAEDNQECRLRCAGERDTRNMGCPSPYDSPYSVPDRALCLKASQEAYSACIKSCPPPQPSAEPSFPPMGY